MSSIAANTTAHNDRYRRVHHKAVSASNSRLSSKHSKRAYSSSSRARVVPKQPNSPVTVVQHQKSKLISLQPLVSSLMHEEKNCSPIHRTNDVIDAAVLTQKRAYMTNDVRSSSDTNDASNRNTFQPSATVKDYAAVSTQNSRFRKYMEDECVVIPNFSVHESDPALSCYFGVFDGHGGNFCSRYAASNLHTTLSSLLADAYQKKRKELEAQETLSTESDVDVLSGQDIHECFQTAYMTTDSELEKHDEAADSGSTAVTCLIRRWSGRTYYYVANAGDSRAVLYSNGMTRRLSIDHKATNVEEVQRIRALNGIVFNKRVGGVVAVTRALGQADEKKFIISDPHFSSGVVESSDSFLVLFSDGISDVFEDEEVTAFVHSHFQQGNRAVTVCKALLDEAKSRGSTDNMTVVIISLAHAEPDFELDNP